MKLGHASSPATELELVTTGPKPRCTANDPTCGPEPFDAERACYDPSATRVRLSAANGAQSTSERCAHDGDCMLVTSCRACVHYSVARHVECEKGFEELDERALCGCLDEGCWFFRN